MPGTSNSGGRNAKSPSAHVLAGTFRDDRHAGHSTPEPPKGRPDPPKPLEGDALAEWDRFCDRLTATEALSRVDDAAIYQAACSFAETENNARLRDETGASVSILEDNLSGLEGADLVACFQEITKLRTLEKSYVTAIRQGRADMRKWLVEFGLTPSSRTRVKLPPAKPQSKVDQFQAAKSSA